MVADADADTTRLRRSTGTVSYDWAAGAFLQLARPASSNAAAALPQSFVFTSDLPSSHRAKPCRRANESGGARAPQCRVRALPARWSGPSRGARETAP